VLPIAALRGSRHLYRLHGAVIGQEEMFDMDANIGDNP
jgi:hypothetical protein